MFKYKNLKVLVLLSTFVLSQGFSADLTSIESLYKSGEYKSVAKKLKDFGTENFKPEHFTFYINSLKRIDLDDAEEAAETAIKAYPNNADMYLSHAGIMGDQAQDSVFSALGYAKKALNSLKKSVEIEPEQIKYRNALMSFYIAAPSIAGGDMDLAYEQANIIQALDEKDGVVARARVYAAQEEPKKAIELLENAIRKNSKSISLYSHLAGFYINADSHQSAINTYKTLSTLPTSVTIDDFEDEDSFKDALNAEERSILGASYQVGRVALASKTDIENGIVSMNAYIQKYPKAQFPLDGLPSLAWAKLRLAGLYYENKQYEEAKNTFKLVELNDKNKQMKKVYKSLNRSIKNID